ncbi:MAG: 50S ribosomal protein L18 [Bacteroidetes bacterium]|nr:50S ribosomal protein L18 [Bacteroidota bacterium]
MAVRKEARRAKLRKKIRSKISGTATKPRLSVFRSNKAIYAQVIDDTKGTTIVSASSTTLKDKLTKVESSTIVGKAIAEKAISAGITEVVFDRGGYLYHGRIKSLADGAREGGLKF